MLAVVFQGVTVVLLLSKIHFLLQETHFDIPGTQYFHMPNMHDVLQQDGSAFVTCHGSLVQWVNCSDRRPQIPKKNAIWVC